MAYNKFITEDGLVLIDLTADTVTANELLEGITAHDKSGAPIIGTAEANSAIPTEVSTEAEMTALLESGELGGVYRYMGETGTYENGAIYVLEAEVEDLVGTWVFNKEVDISVIEGKELIGSDTSSDVVYGQLKNTRWSDFVSLNCNHLEDGRYIGMLVGENDWWVAKLANFASAHMGNGARSFFASATLVLNENINNLTISDEFRIFINYNAKKL